jgi:hypothetical protein
MDLGENSTHCMSNFQFPEEISMHITEEIVELRGQLNLEMKAGNISELNATNSEKLGNVLQYNAQFEDVGTTKIMGSP